MKVYKAGQLRYHTVITIELLGVVHDLLIIIGSMLASFLENLSRHLTFLTLIVYLGLNGNLKHVSLSPDLVLVRHSIHLQIEFILHGIHQDGVSFTVRCRIHRLQFLNGPTLLFVVHFREEVGEGPLFVTFLLSLEGPEEVMVLLLLEFNFLAVNILASRYHRLVS